MHWQRYKVQKTESSLQQHRWNISKHRNNNFLASLFLRPKHQGIRDWLRGLVYRCSCQVILPSSSPRCRLLDVPCVVPSSRRRGSSALRSLASSFEPLCRGKGRPEHRCWRRWGRRGRVLTAAAIALITPCHVGLLHHVRRCILLAKIGVGERHLRLEVSCVGGKFVQREHARAGHQARHSGAS